MAKNEPRTDFTDALRDASLDLRRDNVIYIDPQNQSNLVIATKIRMALEKRKEGIEVRKTRYPQEREYALILIDD